MKRCCRMIIVVVVLGVFLVAPAIADTLLLADFTGLTVGQPVGLGGPALGQPDESENCVATIRNAPFPSTCLEVDDESPFGTGGVHFSFLAAAEVTTGPVEIAVKLWFGSLDNYYFYVREPGFAARDFTSLTFGADGSVTANDAAGFAGLVGTYEAGRAIELIVIHDLDAGTYDIWWDGALALDDRAHGVVGVGVGGVYAGIGHDFDLDGLLYLDDLFVTTGPLTANESRTWGEIKATWR